MYRKRLKQLLSIVLVATFVCSSFANVNLFNTTPIAKALSTVDDSSRNINFNDDWKFQLTTASCEAKAFDDTTWRSLTLPHDFSIEKDYDPNLPANNEVGLLAGGTGWYRKTFKMPATLANKKVTIDFGGVYKDSTTYVNGTKISDNIGGYIPFSYDISTNLICDGVTDNVIAVKVVNRQPSGRWYSGSGIYRNVNLTVTDKIQVKRFGTRVTTPNIATEYNSGNIVTNIETDVSNDTAASANIQVRSSVETLDGTAISNIATSTATAIASKAKDKITQTVTTTTKPQLWDILKGNMYHIKSEVIVGGNVVDTHYTRFGFRWIEFTANDGFYINGKYIKMKGMCMHHDQGALGSVANYRAIERQMQILIDMGVNAIRVTHNPAANELIEICENLGLMVIDEGFDGWNPKKTYDYNGFSSNCTHPEAASGITWAEYDITQMVLRGRNSPSIIMWSLGNEVPEFDGSNVTASNRLDMLKNTIAAVDPTRLVTLGNSLFQYGANNGSKEYCNRLGVVGMNYAMNTTDTLHTNYPNWFMFGSETSSEVKSRGEYAHPNSEGISDANAHPDYQQSSYGNDRVPWGATASNTLIHFRDRRYLMGDFVWTGFDYIGEPTPWHNPNRNTYPNPPKSSFFGIVDLAGFPKDAYYLYQSQWVSVTDKPMVHILPHWNWDDAAKLAKIKDAQNKIPVRIYSNAKKVELFVDGVSQGEKAFNTRTIYFNDKGVKTTTATSKTLTYQEGADASKLYLEWLLPYSGNEILAVAKDASGTEIARDVIKKAAAPAKLDLSMDRKVIKADGADLSYITVDVQDSNGNFNPVANNLINFNITGNGKIVGVENGNAASYERSKDYNGIWKRSAFNGKALVIVQSTKNAGNFTLTATSPGLVSQSVKGYTVTDTTAPKTLLGYTAPIITTIVGVTPTMPAMVEATYSDGSTVNLAITYAAIPPASLNNVGSFTVEGTITSTGVKVQAQVIVIGIVDVKPISIATKIGTIPTLPDKVKLVYSDSSEHDANVTWERALVSADVLVAGTITLQGTVTNTAIKAKAYIRVSNADMSFTTDIAHVGGGFPKLTTNSVPPAANPSYPSATIDNNLTTHWNTWISGGQGDIGNPYVSLEFENVATIGKIDLSFLVDGDTWLPRNLVVQYSTNGTTWTNVENQSKTSGFNGAGGDTTSRNPITFTPIETKYVRLAMTAQANDGVASKFRPVGIRELYVYKGTAGTTVNPKTTASLSAISVDGVPLTDFATDRHSYTLQIPYTKTFPVVTATTKDYATFSVIPANSANTIAKINVTAEDGVTTATYDVIFALAPPKLDTAVLTVSDLTVTEDDIVPFTIVSTLENGETIEKSLTTVVYNISSTNGGVIEVAGDKLNIIKEGIVAINATVTYDGVTKTTNTVTVTVAKNTVVKTIVSYDAVTVVTDKGIMPIMPATVTANYSAGLPHKLNVTWDIINPAQYANYGEFTVQGTVTGETLKPTATVTVKGINAVQNFSTTTPIGKIPNLPVNVTAYISDGTTQSTNINWGVVTAAQFSEVGTVILEGSIEGTTLKSKLSVRVSNTAQKGENIAKQWNGSIYPLAISGFMCAGDTITHMNDDVISYTDTPINRWTNWTTAGRESDWAGIMFADKGTRKMHFVDNMSIAFFKDNGVAAPGSYTIQYYNKKEPPEAPNDHANAANDTTNPLNVEANWTNVTGHTAIANVIDNAVTDFTFDMVQTHALRIKMTKKASPIRGVAITELKVYDKIVTPNDNFELTGLSVANTALTGVATDKLSYNFNTLGAVTATATNNAAVTIIPAITPNGSTKVIVTPENGSLGSTKEYVIKFGDTVFDKGDINGDLSVNIEDAVVAMKVATNVLAQPTGSKLIAGDMNNDGIITVEDVRKIMDLFLV